MKAIAPEKLYIFNPERRGLWFSKTSDKQVEYTRTDAFIEKAIGWIDYNNRNGGCNFDGWEKDFQNYIKGE